MSQSPVYIHYHLMVCSYRLASEAMGDCIAAIENGDVSKGGRGEGNFKLDPLLGAQPLPPFALHSSSGSCLCHCVLWRGGWEDDVWRG